MFSLISPGFTEGRQTHKNCVYSRRFTWCSDTCVHCAQLASLSVGQAMQVQWDQGQKQHLFAVGTSTSESLSRDVARLSSLRRHDFTLSHYSQLNQRRKRSAMGLVKRVPIISGYFREWNRSEDIGRYWEKKKTGLSNGKAHKTTTALKEFLWGRHRCPCHLGQGQKVSRCLVLSHLLSDQGNHSHWHGTTSLNCLICPCVLVS